MYMLRVLDREIKNALVLIKFCFENNSSCLFVVYIYRYVGRLCFLGVAIPDMQISHFSTGGEAQFFLTSIVYWFYMPLNEMSSVIFSLCYVCLVYRPCFLVPVI